MKISWQLCNDTVLGTIDYIFGVTWITMLTLRIWNPGNMVAVRWFGQEGLYSLSALVWSIKNYTHRSCWVYLQINGTILSVLVPSVFILVKCYYFRWNSTIVGSAGPSSHIRRTSWFTSRPSMWVKSSRVVTVVRSSLTRSQWPGTYGHSTRDLFIHAAHVAWIVSTNHPVMCIW